MDNAMIAPNERPTMTQWVGRDSNRYCRASVYPHQGAWVNGRSYAGYPVLFPTREAAQQDVMDRLMPVAITWEETQVPQ